MDERREFDRVKAQLMITVRVIKTGRVWPTLTKDIGGGGVCFLDERTFTLGESLALEIKLPDQGLPVTCRGEVTWSNTLAGGLKGKTAETGVRFVNLDEKDKARIVRYAKYHAAKS